MYAHTSCFKFFTIYAHGLSAQMEFKMYNCRKIFPLRLHPNASNVGTIDKYVTTQVLCQSALKMNHATLNICKEHWVHFSIFQMYCLCVMFAHNLVAGDCSRRHNGWVCWELPWPLKDLKRMWRSERLPIQLCRYAMEYICIYIYAADQLACYTNCYCDRNNVSSCLRASFKDVLSTCTAVHCKSEFPHRLLWPPPSQDLRPHSEQVYMQNWKLKLRSY